MFAHTDFTPDNAKAMLESDKSVIIVDVREEEESCDAAGHIKGALNYPWSSGRLQEKFSELGVEVEIDEHCC